VYQEVPQSSGITQSSGEVVLQQPAVPEAREDAAIVVGRRKPKLAQKVRADVYRDLECQLQRPLCL
jgi:hypothetical protein